MLVVGPTGYIGRFVTKELIARGYKARASRGEGCPAADRALCRWSPSRVRRAA